MLAWDTLARLLAVPTPDPASVLVLRLDNLGDYVLWQSSLEALRELYPRGRYRLTLLANAAWAPWAARGGVFDQVWSFDRGRFTREPLYRLKLLRRVRGGGFGTVLQPRFTRELLLEDAVARVSGAPERVSARDPAPRGALRRWLERRWYTRLLEPVPGPRAELERNADFLRGLGSARCEPRLPVVAPAAPLPHPLAGSEFYVLCPGASGYGKAWPPARFSDVARRIHARTGWTGVVCGSGGERELAATVVSGAEGVPMLNLAGATSLDDMAAVMAAARLVVTNDTGSVHLAAAVGTPAVCVLGGGHVGRFVPYPPALGGGRPLPVAVTHPMACFGCDWVCSQPHPAGGPVPCIAGVPVEAVWSAVEAVLGSAVMVAP